MLAERAEQGVLGAMSEADGHINMLSRLAFVLLAGKPIAPAARVLKQWSFSHALNTDHTAPYREFMHLVRRAGPRGLDRDRDLISGIF